MRILHVVAGIWMHTGGPAEVIPKLCAALVKEGCAVTLLTVDGPQSDSALICKREGVDLVSFPALPHLPIRYTPGIARFLAKETGRYDIIHNNGHWLYPNWVAFSYARRFNKPLITTPHGALVPGMLARATFKKCLSWNIFDRRLINYSSVIHALSKVERDEMAEKVGKRNSSKINIVPNGADIWDLPDPEVLYGRFPQLKGKHVILFLSRVHPIKGIFDLLYVWQIQHKYFPNWHLLIVGPVEKKAEVQVSQYLKEKSMQQATTLAGSIYGDARIEAFAVADLFVLPSYGEGLPTALLEALACKIPVICTDECNFVEAEASGAAFSGPAGAKSLTDNLIKMLNLSDFDRKVMGEKGQALIVADYCWKSIAKRWIKIYEKTISGKCS